MIESGSHLVVVRNWITWKYCKGNGETVTFGKHERITSYPSGHCDLYADDLDQLAQDIRDAVLKEYNVKSKEHKYKFVIIASNPFSQYVDTSYEAWCALYRIEGKVTIYALEEYESGRHKFGKCIVSGTPEKVRNWLLENRLEEQ